MVEHGRQGQKAVAILQARMGSARLPGKSLLPILGKPMLQVIIERVRSAALLDDLIVATTTLARDDPIVHLASELDVSCFRGPEEDCLSRCYQAAARHPSDIVVRITGDNPIVGRAFVDHAVSAFLEGEWDYASTSLGGGYPLGLSVEIISFATFEAAWREDKNPAWREHVTPFIYSHPERFRILVLKNEVDLSHLRWTVDTPEDLAFVRTVFEHLGCFDFCWQDVIGLIQREPQLAKINRCVGQKALHEG